MGAMMSIYEAEESYTAAGEILRSTEDRALWNMNAGFLHLCKALTQIQAQMAEIDRKIVHVSQQMGSQ